MTNKKLVSVLMFYRNRLLADGVESKQYDDYNVCATTLPVEVHLAHVVWMCDQAVVFVAEDRVQKAMRWLGYIQGVLFMAGMYTLDDLRDHSRPDPVDPEAFRIWLGDQSMLP